MNAEEIDDGGPAFPRVMPRHESALGGKTLQGQEHPGMSLRDHFAGEAMKGYLGRSDLGEFADDKPTLAKHSYTMADAMIAARKGQAAIIAAAPDAVKALRVMFDVFDCAGLLATFEAGRQVEASALARDAIAKAEGKA